MWSVFQWLTRSLRSHPAESSWVRVRAFPLRFSASAPVLGSHRHPPPPNNSFKPTPCRGVGHVLYATLAHVRRPATGRLNSGVRPYWNFPVTEKNNIAEDVNEHLHRAMRKITISLQAYNFVLHAHVATLDKKNEPLIESLKILEKYLDPMELKVRDYFRSLLFVDLISELELFFSSLIRLIILKNPKKIGAAQFKLTDVIEASNIDELVTRAADDFLYKLLYKKPSEYLSDMCSVLSIDQSIVAPYWAKYIEAKARRDLGTHNDWKCNQTYLRKLSESGITTNFSLGSSLIPENDYFNEVVISTASMAQVMAEAVIEKHATPDKG